MKTDWREELQVEVMEDFVRLAEIHHMARDPKTHMELRRKKWEELCGWIQSFAAVESQKAQEKVIQDIWLRIEHTSGARGNYRSVEIIDTVKEYAEENGFKLVASHN